MSGRQFPSDVLVIAYVHNTIHHRVIIAYHVDSIL